MKEALPETLFIYNKLFSNEQKVQIQAFLDEVKINKENYDSSILWILDQKIGGIGGYCMPANPVKNPFPGGVGRELFRPLQYARSEIDISDIRMHARYVVHNSGMHLEAVLRLFLKSTKTLGSFRYSNSTLGKAVNVLSKMNVFDSGIIETLFKFISLYNQAKHDVNQDENRPRLFSAADAIICYFCARIVGQVILLKLKYPESIGIYEIKN